MNTQTEQPKGRSMKELRAILAAMDARQADLLDAWENLSDADQDKVILYARSLVKADS